MSLKLSLKIGDSEQAKFADWAARQTINPYKLDYHPPSKFPTKLISEGVHILNGGRNELARALRCLTDQNNPCLLVELSGLPLDDLTNIPSPTDGRAPKGKTFVSELACMALAQIMNVRIRVGRGEKPPFNFPFHQVVPQKGHEDEGSNEGAGYFTLHQDRIFAPDPPDFLLLYGLREEAEVPTYFYPLSNLLKVMPEDLYHELFKPHFKDPKDPNSTATIPLLEGSPDNSSNVISRLDLEEGWIEGTTEKARQALAYLQQKDKSRKEFLHLESVLISPGVAVISDHRRLLHGRDGFNTKYQRWLQRVHLVRGDSGIR